MSIKTWLAEFYPVSADTAVSMTNLQAVQHSLRKWIGLRKENLQAHNVAITSGYFPKYVVPMRQKSMFANPSQSLRIDSESCALCIKHDDVTFCRTCPLTRTRGCRCDRPNPNLYTTDPRRKLAPWYAWVQECDPEPMIALLQKAEATLLKAAKK